MTEPVEAGTPLRRGFVRIGGKPIAEHQLDIALSFGCERIICMVKSLEPEVIALQHLAEDAGKLFHVASSPRDLSGLVTATDELVVLTEGLLADPERAKQVLEMGSGVFVQPVETGLAAGFERIDINHASAGMLRIPGRYVEMLVQLPEECDVPSALTRIALQSGAAMREVPAEARSGMRWQLITSENDAFTIEHAWLAEKLGNPRLVSPGRWIAQQAILNFGTSLLHAGNASALMTAGTLAAMLVALGFAWLGSLPTAFIACAVGWVLIRSTVLLRRLEMPLQDRSQDGISHITVLNWLFDVELVVLVLWASHAAPQESVFIRIFAPLIFFLLIRIVPNLRNMIGSAWISDRAVLCLVFSVVAAIGGMDWMIRLGAIGLAVAAVAISRDHNG